MNTGMEKKITSHIIKGLLAALVLIIYDVASHFFNFKYAGWFAVCWCLILVAAIIWGCITYGRQMDHNVTYGSLFTHGFKITAVLCCIWFVYTLLTVYVFFPGMINEIIDRGIEEAKKRGNYSDENMKRGIGRVRSITRVVILAGAVLGPLIVGVIGALLGAAFAKKSPRTPFE